MSASESPRPFPVPLRVAILAAVPLAGCAGPTLFGPGGWDPAIQSGPQAQREPMRYRQAGDAQAAPMGEATPGQVQGPAQVPLLGWDGGVVDAAPQGSVVDGRGPSHGIEPSTAGRMHIIELYQKVLDERDALRDEVQALTAALEKSQLELARQEHASEELAARVTELEARTEELAAEGREMAARLTTAQIRRLEAEKLLLETRIAAYRAAQGEEAGDAMEHEGAESGS